MVHKKKPSYKDLEKEISKLNKEIESFKSVKPPVNSKIDSGEEKQQDESIDNKSTEGVDEYLSANEELKQLNEMLELAKSEAERSEERLQLIIKNSNDIFVLVNEKGEQHFISDVAVKLTGYTQEELSGPIKNVIYPDDVETIKEHWSRVINNKDKADRVEYRHIHKEKGYIWLEAIAQNFLDHPAINAVVANIRDITERKEIEEALRVSEAAKMRLYNLERNRIFNELIDNQKKLASATLKSFQDAERDAEMVKQIETIMQYTNNKGKQALKNLIVDYKRASVNSNWQEFETVFEKIHHEFYKKLTQKFTSLTPNEIKLCVFIKLNMSSKDISRITFQSADALKKARYRLRQKLGVEKGGNITAFLNAI